MIRDLATRRCVESAENVVFLGLPGLGVAAIEQRISVPFINVSALIEPLKEAYHPG